jgi:hypothetical protein
MNAIAKPENSFSAMTKSPRLFNDLTATAGTSQDPLGMDTVRAVARQIQNAIRDPKMDPSIAQKVARAVTTRKLGAGELTEILDTVIATREAGRIKKSTGALFVHLIKRAFQYNEIPW